MYSCADLPASIAPSRTRSVAKVPWLISRGPSNASVSRLSWWESRWIIASGPNALAAARTGPYGSV